MMSKYDHDNVVPIKQSVLSKKDQVADMFDSIAYRYDFLNRFLSIGIDTIWRKNALKELRSLQPKIILDVATGTADVAILAAKRLKATHITGIDISNGMLEIGRKKIADIGLQQIIQLQNGDSAAIMFDENSFDAVTVAFGVRNFQDLELGLKEIRRVLKPGGKLVVLEFSKPSAFGVRHLYQFYMKVIAPLFGKLFSKNKAAYEYLDESINKFPEGKNFVNILEKTGYKNTYSKPQHLGICSIYCGEK